MGPAAPSQGVRCRGAAMETDPGVSQALPGLLPPPWLVLPLAAPGMGTPLGLSLEGVVGVLAHPEVPAAGTRLLPVFALAGTGVPCCGECPGGQ